MKGDLVFISLLMTFTGYWFLRILESTRLSLLRASGYHVALSSFLASGLMLTLAGAVFWSFGVDILTFWEAVRNPPHPGMVVLAVAFFAFALPHLMNKVAERFWSRPSPRLFDTGDRHFAHRVRCWFFCTQKEAAWIDAEARGDVTQKVLLRSLYDQELVEFVLTTGESYIGIAVGRDETYGVALVPMMKSSRSSTTAKVKTGFYKTPNIADYLVEFLWGDKLELEEFQQVIVQMRSIVRIRIFTLEDLLEQVLEQMEAARKSDSESTALTG